MARVNKLVLHTTETLTWPGYGEGKTAPTLTARWNGTRLEYRQHFPLHSSARALRNTAGGVATNTLDCAQIELVGTCSASFAQRTGAVYWPRASRAQKAALRDLLRLISAHTAVPLQSAVSWKSYKEGQVGGSYGSNNGVRLSGPAWTGYRGLLGHQHVPENDHGDPGDIDIAFLLSPPSHSKPSGDDELNETERKQLADLHAEMSARKAGRSDAQLAADELTAARALTKDDVAALVSRIADEVIARLTK